MNYNFTTLTTIMVCLFLIVFTDESHAQYNSSYDSEGNYSPSSRAASEARNKQIISPNDPRYYKPSNNNSSSSPGVKSPESSMEKLERWTRERKEEEARKEDAERKEKEAEAERRNPYVRGFKDENGLYLIQRKATKLYGYHDVKTDMAVIPISYTDYKSPSEGYYALKTNNGWGFLDKTAKIMIPFKYQQVLQTFENGIAWVMLANRKIWINKYGAEISDQQAKDVKLKARLAPYSYVAPTADENGLRLAIKNSNGVTYYSYLNAENTEAIGLKIDYKPLSEGYYAVKYDPYWIFVDKNGKKMIDEVFTDVLSTFKNGRARVVLRKISTAPAPAVWIDKNGYQDGDPRRPKEIVENKTITPPINSDEVARVRSLVFQAHNRLNLYHANNKLELKKYQEAITIYTETIEENVKTPVSDAYYGRGKARLLLNEKESACVDLKMAASLGHPGANELISKNCN